MNPNNQWLRRLLSGKPHFVIGGDDNPYLLRWFLIPRNHYLNIYLHKFLRSDDDRALHDHPWWFASLILRGSYIEVLPDAGFSIRKAPSIAFRPAAWVHRVKLFRNATGAREERPVWTLIITGPKRRHWGFWCPKGFVPWEKFTAPTGRGNTISAGCGEN